MLIDFDSISWKFLYQVLSHFGYSDSFIKWVKLFNTNITAFVVQCGFLSDPINIMRGCRQGDPISPYLFLIGAEILARLIQKNNNIKGLSIKGIEFKLTQFADDTTIILDGSQQSLQATLNTLEIYGSISGLKINTDKTKIIWIGKKKTSKDKLDVSIDLEWGCTEFTLLGIHFSTNLSTLTEINQNKVLGKIRKNIKSWNNRYLTPFGKVTVIKTYLVSQCVHLMSTLPISESFLREVNHLFYNFLWNGKPDKIKRSTANLKYIEGGINMINIFNFEKALKVSWMKKLISKPNSQWHKLINILYKDLNMILTHGDQWFDKITHKIHNQFWQDVLKAWNILNKQLKAKEDQEILRYCIWYNSKISKDPIFFADWHKRGIYFLHDILNSDGHMLEIGQLNQKFQIRINILNYYTMKFKIQTFLANQKTLKDYRIEQPAYPFHLDVLFKSQKGIKKIYETFNTAEHQCNQPISKIIWTNVIQNEYPLSNMNETWKLIYKICFFAILDNNIIWFQYRLLNKILGTKEYLKKTKISTNSTCSLCQLHDESITHLFSECYITNVLWENVQHWINNKLSIHLNITKAMKILGYLIYDENFWPLNFVLLTTRKYIFHCSKNSGNINIYFLQREAKKIYLEQEALSRVKLKPDIFQRKWQIWKNIFNEIEI